VSILHFIDKYVSILSLFQLCGCKLQYVMIDEIVSYLCYKDEKKIFRTISWKLLDEATPSPATAMSPNYRFRPCIIIIHYFLVDCNKNTRKNVHSIVKVTFDP
jgi:hypothetical protein